MKLSDILIMLAFVLVVLLILGAIFLGIALEVSKIYLLWEGAHWIAHHAGGSK